MIFCGIPMISNDIPVVFADIPIIDLHIPISSIRFHDGRDFMIFLTIFLGVFLMMFLNSIIAKLLWIESTIEPSLQFSVHSDCLGGCAFTTERRPAKRRSEKTSLPTGSVHRSVHRRLCYTLQWRYYIGRYYCNGAITHGALPMRQPTARRDRLKSLAIQRKIAGNVMIANASRVQKMRLISPYGDLSSTASVWRAGRANWFWSFRLFKLSCGVNRPVPSDTVLLDSARISANLSVATW